MADIRLIHTPTMPGEVGLFDVGVYLGDFDSRDELGTALHISLFTDRRANPDDPLPVDGESRRGFWGDQYSEFPNDLIGSRLWLLSREKQTNETLARAKEYVNEAVAWLLQDGVASQVDVAVEWVAMGVLGIQLDIYRPTGELINYRYNYAWEQLANPQPPSLAEIEAYSGYTNLTTEDDEFLITENETELIA